MNKLILIIALCFTQVSFADSTISNSKKALIDKLLTQMGQSSTDTGKLFSNLFIEQLVTSLKKSKPDIDPKAFDIIEEEVKISIDEILIDGNAMAEIMYPIYGGRFSETELKELIAFNETPLGKKMIRELPAITQEGMKAGQKLGESLGPKIQQRVVSRFNREGIKI